MSELLLENVVKRMLRVLPDGGVVYAGIDPGAQGAVAFLAGGEAYVADVPTVKVTRKGGTKTEFNLPAIAGPFILLKKELGPSAHYFIALEQALVQIGGRGANAYTAYRVGYAYGLWPLFLVGLGFSLTEYHPAAWKAKMGLHGKDKEYSRSVALKMFPGADLWHKKDHNRAEALLLAEHHRRCCEGRSY